MRAFVITIDGPAGAGKSTVARLVAEALGIAQLDTGAMYRAVTATALAAKIELGDPEAIAAFMAAHPVSVSVAPGVRTQVRIAGKPVDDAALRTPEVARAIGRIADHPAVRASLGAVQRATGEAQALVTEGRDQGSAVFPNAEYKFYLDASLAERARRRLADYEAQGEPRELAAVIAEVRTRDAEDARRPVGALCVPAGAVVLATDDLTAAGIAATIVAHVRPATNPA